MFSFELPVTGVFVLIITQYRHYVPPLPSSLAMVEYKKFRFFTVTRMMTKAIKLNDIIKYRCVCCIVNTVRYLDSMQSLLPANYGFKIGINSNINYKLGIHIALEVGRGLKKMNKTNSWYSVIHQHHMKLE